MLSAILALVILKPRSQNLFNTEGKWDFYLIDALFIVYLGIVGSLLSFLFYYYLLRELSAFAVSTVGMISPVFVLLLGTIYEGESLKIKRK